MKTKFYLLEVSYWISLASLTLFSVAFAHSRGLAYSDASYMVALSFFSGFIGQFFWGSITDKIGSNKRIFLLSNAIVLILYTLIYFIRDLGFMFGLFVMLGFIQAPIASNLDTWLLRSFDGDLDVYGLARGWSTVGFGIFMLIYAPCLAITHFSIVPYATSLTVLCNLILAMTIKERSRKTGTSQTMKKSDILRLFGSGRYVLLLILVFFAGLVMSPLINMKIAIYESVGAGVAYQGYEIFLSSVVQTPILMQAGKLRRFNPFLRLLVAYGALLLQVILISFTDSAIVIMLAAMLTSLTIGLQLPVLRELVIRHVPSDLSTTANSVTDAAFGNMAGMISMLYAGIILAHSGVKQLLYLSALIQTIPVIILLILIFHDHLKTSKVKGCLVNETID